jgi:predicted kinase
MAKLYVLVGVPGSGKSTWYANNEDLLGDTVYVSTDDFVEQEAARQGKTYNDVFKDYMPTAVKLMAGVVNQARALNMDIVWDQTSTTINSRKKKFNMLPNYEHIAVVFKTPEKAELERRLASRLGKRIPEAVMKTMIDGWEEPTKDEGFIDIWYV